MNFWLTLTAPIDKLWKGVVYNALRLGVALRVPEPIIRRLIQFETSGQVTTLPGLRDWYMTAQLNPTNLALRGLGIGGPIQLFGSPLSLTPLIKQYEIVVKIVGIDESGRRSTIFRSVFTDQNEISEEAVMDAVKKTVGGAEYGDFQADGFEIVSTWTNPESEIGISVRDTFQR